MIPLVHDFSDERVLVFGGGAVGARKARRFDREARVIVVSPTFADGEFGDASLVRAAPDASGVGDWIDRMEPALVVAATDDERLNAAVETEARDRGLLVNRADRAGDRDPGSVVVPATIRDDPVVVAVSTGGTSPALSKRLREDIEKTLDGAGAMAEVTEELRGRLRDEGVAPDRRRAAVSAVVNSCRVWKALRDGTTNPRRVVDDVLTEELSDDERTDDAHGRGDER